MNSQPATNDSNLNVAAEELQQTIFKFTNFLSSIGICIRPFSRLALEKMTNISPEGLRQINSNLLSQLRVFHYAQSQSIDIRNTKMFVRSSLSYMGLVTTDEFLDSISAGDVVEAYDLSQRQIFRNMRFYELTQYSLSDLLVFEWHELYSRPSATMTKMIESVNKILAKNENILPMNVPTHLMKEIKANPIHVSRVDFKFISPTFDQARTKAGFIVSCHGENLAPAIQESSVDFI